MADYIEQVKIIGVVEADTSNLDAALDKYNKPIDIKVRFNGDNPFDNIQKDIKRIESSISSINFDALNKHLASSLQKGATEGLKEVKKITSSTMSKQLEELSKTKSELQKLQNSFNGMSQGMIKGGLDAALRGTLLLPIDQMREAQEEIKYLDQSLSNISTPGKLDKILSNIKSSLANIGGKELEESFSNYWEKAIQSSKEYQAILSQLETTQKKYNSLSSQNSSNNSSVNKMNQGLNEAKQSLRELDSLFNQVIGKTSKGKEITFGDSIKSTYNNLADLNKKLSSVISNDGQDNYTIKISVVGIEDILAKMQQLNSSTDSFQRNLQELNGISLFSGIESQFKEITSSITTLVGDIKVLKDSLESINKNVVLPQVETNSKSVSKNTLSNDEYEAVQDIARNNAKTLFQSKNMQILSMETKQLESGLAKVKATVKSAEGEWQNFNATITKTGALINQNFVTASDPISLDKKLDRLKTRGNNFSTEELLSQAQRIRTELGLIDNETWSIRVDSSGLVTIKNELAKTSDGAAKAVQTFKSAEEAIQKFNQAAKQSSVTLGQTTSKAKSSNELPDVKAIKDHLKQVEEIQKALDTNKLLSRNSALFKEYSGYSNVGLASKDLDSQIQNIKEYMRVLDDLNQKSKEAGKAGKALEADDASKMVNTYKQLTAAMNTAENEIKSLKNAYGGLTTEQQRMRASNSMLKWLEQNSRATKQYGEEIKQLANDVQTAYTKMDFDKIQNRMSNIKLDAYNMGLTGKSLTESLKNSMGTVTQLFGSYSLIDRADDVAREMVSTIHEVDDALTDLKMATGVSDSEASKLMETYSQMGKTLKATGVDVATSATEWLKQGRTLSEAENLAEDSIILSKIGDLSSEDSTKYLTSAMKGYKIEAEDALSVVDKLSAVDLVSATDVGGLAEGMSEVAASAELAGVSMDRLLSYLAVVGETTQQGMSSVGNSMNAIFARMGNIKLARLKDYQNSGEDLSDVETVLKGEGINLRDENKQFRNFGEVLDEVAANWENYSSVSQRAIAKAFAGTHHMNNFIVLMENYSTAMDYMKVSAESSGQSLEKFSAYQESLTGSIEDFKNSFQTLSNTFVGSDFLKGIVDSGTDALDVLDAIVKALGVLPSLATGIGIFQGIKGGGWSSQEFVCVSS